MAGHQGHQAQQATLAGHEAAPLGSYNYLDGDRVVTGEIWCSGPLHATVWVLGPDGPVVVDIRNHRRRAYDMPTYYPGETHQWRHDRWSSGIAPIELRGRKCAVTLTQWAELTEDAFDVREVHDHDTDGPRPSWEYALDTPLLAFPDTDV